MTVPTPSSCPLCGRTDGHDHIFNRKTGHFDNLAAESRTKTTEKKYWVALLQSAVVPGLGSAYAGDRSGGVRCFLLFALALWAALGSKWGIALAAATWVLGMDDAYVTVRAANRGYRDNASYQSGYRTGKSLYYPPSVPPMTALPPTAQETQTTNTMTTTTKEVQ
jgi:hypothetical protein